MTWLPSLVLTLGQSINVENFLTFKPCLCFPNPSVSSSAQLPEYYLCLKTEWQKRESGGGGSTKKSRIRSWRLNVHRKERSEDRPPHPLLTTPNVVKDKSMEVKTPSKREGKDLAGPAKTDSSGETDLPNIQFKEVGGSDKIQTKLFSFQKSSSQTRGGSKSCLRVDVI